MKKPKPKKRGRKLGVKVEPYKKKRKGIVILTRKEAKEAGWNVSENMKPYTPAPILTLCGQLEDAILLLETRVSNAIAKINSLM